MHGQPGRWSGPFLLSPTRDCPAPLRLMLVNGPCPSQIVSTGCHNKCHRLRDLNSRHVFSHSYEGWKSTIRMPADLVPQGRLSSWPADSCLLTVSFQVWERVSKLSCASFYKDTNPTVGGALMTSNPNHLPRAPHSDTIALRLGLQPMNFGGNTNIQFITRGPPRILPP